MTDLKEDGHARPPVWQTCAEALKQIKAGAKPDTLKQDVVIALISANLLRSEEVTKPCRTCGHRRLDYHFWQITSAGHLLLAAADAADRDQSHG